MTITLSSHERPETGVGISVFFPAFNDEGSIKLMVEKTLALLPRLTNDYEVFVVDDGSSDGTAQILDDLALDQPRLKVIHHSINKGYGGALRTGFLNATKELIFYTDGDGQYDVNDLTKLMSLMNEGVDVVNGYKIKRSDSKRRVILGEVYKFLARVFFGLPVRDVDCDFRLIRRAAIQKIALLSNSGVVCTELVFKLHQTGCRFAEAPIPHYPRRHGQSQFFTFSRVGRTAWDFLGLWLALVVKPKLINAPASFAHRFSGHTNSG